MTARSTESAASPRAVASAAAPAMRTAASGARRRSSSTRPVDRPVEEPPEHGVDRRRTLAVGARHVGLLRLVVGVRHPPQDRAEHHEQEGPLVVAAVEGQDGVAAATGPRPTAGVRTSGRSRRCRAWAAAGRAAGARHRSARSAARLSNAVGVDGGRLGPGDEPGQRVDVDADGRAAPQHRFHQRGARSHERVDDDASPGARSRRPPKASSAQAGHLGDELGGEAVQAVGVGRGRRRQAEGEELAGLDTVERRKGLDLGEGNGVDGGGA